jgi:hypothetical protein
MVVQPDDLDAFGDVLSGALVKARLALEAGTLDPMG